MPIRAMITARASRALTTMRALSIDVLIFVLDV